jgi:hypothetical protein
MEKVLTAWRGVVSGPSSKAACKARYAARVEKARASLEAKIKADVALGKQFKPKGWRPNNGDNSDLQLSDKAVLEEMNKGLFAELVELRKHHAKAHYFINGFKKLVEVVAEAGGVARQHYGRVLCGKVFGPWREWTNVHAKVNRNKIK